MPKDPAHPVLKYFSGTLPENSGGVENSAEKSNINSKKLFLLHLRIQSGQQKLTHGL
jgi:hypothetical protein